MENLNNDYPENYLIETGFGYERNSEYMFSRNRYIPYGAVNLFASERNHYSCFCTTYRYNSRDIDNALKYGDLYFDFDSIDDFEKVRKDAMTVISFLYYVFSIQNTECLRIYYSGNKGVHIMVPAIVLGIEPHVSLNNIYKHIATIAKGISPNKTIDTQIYDNKRMFRIPNSIHEKSKLYKIPITIDELENLSIDEIRNLAKSPRQITYKYNPMFIPAARKRYEKMIEEYMIAEKDKARNNKKRFQKKLDFVPPCIDFLLKNGAREGERNLSIACISGFCKSYGRTLEETIEFITDWNDNNIKPTGKQEMIKTVKSIFTSEKQFGCSTLDSISVCDKSCKIYIKKKEKNNGDKVE